MSRYLSLNVWAPDVRRGHGYVQLVGFSFDWLFDHGFTVPDHLSVTVHLLGFGVCLTVWPRGKA